MQISQKGNPEGSRQRRLFERAFVLVLLAEIAPELTPPTQTLSNAALCSRLDTSGIIRLEETYA